MTKKILALCMSMLMVMSLFCAVPVSAETTLPDNIGTDYEVTEITGNLFTDLDNVSGYTHTYSHSTTDLLYDKIYSHQNIVLAGETLETTSAVYTKGDVYADNWTTGNGFTMTANRAVLDPWSVYADSDADGVYTLDESQVSYKVALAGAKLKVPALTYAEDGTLTVTSNTYPTLGNWTDNVVVRIPLSIKSGTGTAKVNIARSKYQSDAIGGPNYYAYTGNQASDHEYPMEYNGRNQGVTVAADGTTYLIGTFAGNTTAEADPKYSYTLGMTEGTDAGMVVLVEDADFYIGYEYAKDLEINAATTTVSSDTPITLDADVLNQLGAEGGISQEVTWYAVNEARDTAVDGFTIAEGADGKAEVSVVSSVAAGDYYIVAVADADENLVKGIKVTVENIDLSKDYEPGARTGNLLLDDEGNFLSALSGNGHSSVTASATLNDESGFKVGMYKAVSLADKTANTRAASGAVFSLSESYGLYNNLNSVWTPGNVLVFGADVSSTNVNYEPQVNFGFYQSSYPQIMPIEYPSTNAGFQTEQGVEKSFGATLVLPEKLNAVKTYTIMEFGFSNTTATQMEVFVPYDSLYLGLEEVYDIDVTSDDTTLLPGKEITVDADVLNQVGVPGTLSQGVTWVAMNSARTEAVDGFAITEGADGTAKVTVDASVAAGSYYLVAVADESSALVQGIEVTVADLTQDYEAGAVTGDLIADDEEKWSTDYSAYYLDASGNKQYMGEVGTKSDTGEWYALYNSNFANVGDNSYGVSGGTIYLGNTEDGYTNLRALISNGTVKAGSHIVFGALVDGLYDTPTISATMRGTSSDEDATLYPKEYKNGEGYSPVYGGGYEQFGVTFELDENVAHAWNAIMRMGFVNGSTTESTEAFVMKKGSMYLGIEYAYDMKLDVTGETTFTEGQGGTFTVDASVLNQVGSTGYLTQDVTWLAMNDARNAIASEVTLTENANGTVTVAVAEDAPIGTYKLVAVADDYTSIVKSVNIVVEEEVPPIEDITISETENGITVATDTDLTDAMLIFATYEGGRLTSVNIDTKVTLAAQNTQEYTIPAGYENAKVMLWTSDFEALANALN